tara:strand:+ start:479 stop:970 length:492 start_codon:yes stop_codon:yes gene_type:complete
MPNHTDNRVILSHDDSQQIDAIYNIMNTEDTPLCQTLIPMDEKLLEISGFSDNYEVQGWYEWRLENWGTKWDVYETHCTRIDANTLQLYFYTAWSPPIPIFDKLVDMGFEVDARYLDEGWMYIGEYVNGDDWSTEDVDNIGSIRPELDDEFGISQMVEEMSNE